MKNFTLAKLLGVFLIMGFVMTACDDDDNPTNPTVTPPATPTGLMATSLSNTSVGLKWTASTSETETDFAGYTLTISDGTNTPNKVELAAGTVAYVADGLVEGTVYTFSLKARLDDGTLSTNAVEVAWSPASRFTEIASNAIALYEHSSQNASGLELYNSLEMGPSSVTIAGDFNESIDILFDSRTMEIGSPTKSAYVLDNGGTYKNGGTPRTTLVGAVFNDVASLDAIYDTEALDQIETLQEKIIDFSGFTKSFAFVVKTTNGNFAKVLVKADSNGNFIQGAEPNRYIVVELSYQKVANIPHAVFQNPPRAAEPTAKELRQGVSYDKRPYNP